MYLPIRFFRCSVFSLQCCFTDSEVAEEWAKRSLLGGPTCLAEDSGEICWQACERCPIIHIMMKSRFSSENRSDEVVPRAIGCSKGTCLERQELVGATLAPKTRETLEELQGRRPQERVREIPVEMASSVNLDNIIFSKCLSSAPSGSAPGPGGCTYEMLKVCLGDAEATHLLFRAAEDLARAEAPEPITRAFMTATMTALSEPDGGVRGIATGTSFRRLVAKTLARQFGKVVESTCAPFQFALSTRAGTDCVGHTIRAMTDDDMTTFCGALS